MKKSKITKSFFNFQVLLFIIIMLLPTILQFVHVFEKHEQTNCNVLTAHIHEHEIECSICDFHFLSFDYSFATSIEFTLKKNLTTYADYYKSKKHNSIKLSYSLRGPPLFY